MIVVKIVILSLMALLISVGMLTPSFAHTTVEVEQYKIESNSLQIFLNEYIRFSL